MKALTPTIPLLDRSRSMTPCIPQLDPRPSLRKEAISRARSQNQFDFSYNDIGYVRNVPFWDGLLPHWKMKAARLNFEVSVNQMTYRFVKSGRGYARQIFDRSRSRICLLYTSPSPRDRYGSRMPSSA